MASLARLAGDDQMNAVCPVWEGVTILRDELTEAAKGWITAVSYHGRPALYSFKIPRPKGGFLFPAAPFQAELGRENVDRWRLEGNGRGGDPPCLLDHSRGIGTGRRVSACGA